MGKGTKGSKGRNGSTANGFSTIEVDPRRVRYAHSKIKPIFSGCGRTIEQTLNEMREGKTLPADLPAITVILGPVDPVDGQPCFFSLNNRRLFVFKACREEGLLGASGLVSVRARGMKAHERERYTLDRCSLQAKFLFAAKPSTIPGASEDSAADARRTPEGDDDTARGAMVLSHRRECGEDIDQLMEECSVQDGNEVPKEKGSGGSVGDGGASGKFKDGMQGEIPTEGSRSREGRGAGRGGQCIASAEGVMEGDFGREEATRKQERSTKGRRRRKTAAWNAAT